MVRLVCAAIVGLLATATLVAQTAPATVMSGAEVTSALAAAAAASPDMMVARMKNTDAYRVNVVKRITPQGAIAHDVGTEVHYIIEGRGTLVTGGAIVRGTAPEGGGRPALARIAGGETRVVSRGDIVLVPVGTPHWYSQIEQPLTYLEVRFDVKER